MASRGRGDVVKSDVAGSGFLNWIPSDCFVAAKWQALYYRILKSLGYPEISETEPDRGILAWMIAMTMVRVVDAYDMRECSNQIDATRKMHDRERLPVIQKELMSLLSQFRRGVAAPEAEQEAKSNGGADIRDVITQLMSDPDPDISN